MVRCADASLYTGWTVNIEKRMQIHNSGKGAKYTRVRRPVELVGFWQFASSNEAMSFEYKCKKLRRQEKLKLLESAQAPVDSTS